MNVNTVSVAEKPENLKKIKSQKNSISIGSLYVCNMSEARGLPVYEVYQNSGEWSSVWISCDTGRHVSVRMIACNVPLLIIDTPTNKHLNSVLREVVSASLGINPAVICLYEERLVMLPQIYFERQLFSFNPAFYKELKADA